MADETLVAFSPSDANELLKLIKGQLSGGSVSNDAISDNATWIAVATSTITARSGSTLGTGTAQIKYIDNANTLQNLFTTDVVNMGSAIANGAHMKAFRVGNKISVVEIC